MEKILVEIRFCQTGEAKDFWAPNTMQTGLLALLGGQEFGCAAAMLPPLFQDEYIIPLLCEAQSGRRLDPQKMLWEEGIKNGSRLLLY